MTPTEVSELLFRIIARERLIEQLSCTDQPGHCDERCEPEHDRIRDLSHEIAALIDQHLPFVRIIFENPHLRPTCTNN
jgi:hypothetical protein